MKNIRQYIYLHLYNRLKVIRINSMFLMWTTYEWGIILDERVT
ncbi:protein of unknown function [Clostridium beijerinckii]|nr:protein of unknown function [Clostridium beijerinckii]